MDLHEAARQGNVNDIESAIEEGCDVNARDKHETPLWFAVQRGHLDACRILIARGARVEEQNPSILELAVQEGHAEIVELLWPYCDGEREYRCLEMAISLGFHGIADFFVKTHVFEYQQSQAGDLEMLKNDGFPRRGIEAFQQWERFIFVRRSEKLRLHPILFDYALLLATKADRNAGFRLATLLLEGDSPLADANCMIKVDAEIETPLTNAAEKGNLEILMILIRRPDTRLTICGKYGWPAFLHLLANPGSIASEKGRSIARKLSNETLPDSLIIDGKGARLETVFTTVLRLGDDVLVKQVINLVLGAAGNSILPLLIRANEALSLRWVLNSDIAHASKPPPTLWVLLCDFFQRNPGSEALKLFIRVAEFMTEKAIWDRMILTCLNSSNFCFVKQFFYPLNELPPREVTEETLAGLSQASMDQSLIREWADKGFANAALWSAVRSGIWKSPAFESLLSCSYVDPNEPFPRGGSSYPGQVHKSSPGEKRKFQYRPAEDWIGLNVDPGSPHSHVLQDYQMQLMLLEQQNKRRLASARKEQESSLAWTMGKSPLAWAAANQNTQLVEFLLRTSRVNVNSQDTQNRTALIHAIAANDRQTVEKLLKSEDIDLNLPDDIGRTAVFHAAQMGCLHIIRLLTETQKVDLSIRDCDGQTVIDFAKKNGKRDVVAVLATRLD